MSTPDRLVHIIDDDLAVRDSLRWLLEGEGLAARTYASAEEFLGAFRDDRPACAVVDLRMPGMSGLELQEALLRRHVMLPLVFVTAHGDVQLAVMAMRRGAVDFVEKPVADERLVAAVHRALTLHARPFPGEKELGIWRARTAGLSRREHEVLAGVTDGKSSKAIGAELGIATKTVEAHRARIMARLGTTSLAELVRLVVQFGLPAPPLR